VACEMTGLICANQLGMGNSSEAARHDTLRTYDPTYLLYSSIALLAFSILGFVYLLWETYRMAAAK
jgi:hypothetical protein